MPTDIKVLETLGVDRTIPAEINGRKNGAAQNPAWESAYHPCPEAFPGDAIAPGDVSKFTAWRETKVYPGTTRELWLYKPACFDPSRESRIMFFNDGLWYASHSGPVRATRVLDTFHASNDFQQTVAVFIMPGMPDKPVTPKPIESYGDREAQRSLEYDMLSPDYGRFLFEEILPFVESELESKISDDPAHRLTCGISSGGIAAFTAAWHFPNECTRVLSHCGSFTSIWGGHNYPALIRSTPRKPLRIYLQSGENDADTPFGNWALANQTMADSLRYADYDYHFEFGTGGHNLNHGGALFADAIRWLWRDSGDAP